MTARGAGISFLAMVWFAHPTVNQQYVSPVLVTVFQEEVGVRIKGRLC